MIPYIIRNVNNIFLERPKCSLCNYDFASDSIIRPDICYNLKCVKCKKIMHTQCYNDTDINNRGYTLCPLCPICDKVGCIATNQTKINCIYINGHIIPI